MKKAKAILLFGVMALAIQLSLCPHTASAEGEWKRDISLGYNKSTGNTENSELNIAGAIEYKMEHSAFSSSGDIYYSETNDQMDSQKWSSLTRYAFDFGEEYTWFNSYQFEVTHDRFSDIDYRLLPSVGIGYWFSREEDWTWSADVSAGYEMTKYRSDRDNDNSPVILGHTFMKKRILENAFLSEDFTVIPTLDNTGTRIKSETEFTNPLADGLDLSIKYVLDHDTEPSPGKKKTDTRIMTSIKYSF